MPHKNKTIVQINVGHSQATGSSEAHETLRPAILVCRP